jgi:hypothetical protein
MANSSQKNHAYMYDKKFTKHTHNDRCYNHVVLPGYHTSHAMVASSSTYAYGRNKPRRNHVVSHAPRRACNGPTTCRRFNPGGVPGPTSKLFPRAPAQMGRRETEREGGKPEGDRR